jgi:hypothetical protein
MVPTFPSTFLTDVQAHLYMDTTNSNRLWTIPSNFFQTRNTSQCYIVRDTDIANVWQSDRLSLSIMLQNSNYTSLSTQKQKFNFTETVSLLFQQTLSEEKWNMRKQLTKPLYNCRTLILRARAHTHAHIHSYINTCVCVCVCHVVTLRSKKLPNKITSILKL